MVGIAAGAACTALTAGVGAVACAAAAGAVANAVGYAMSDGPHTLSGYLGAAAVGGLTGLAGGGAGALAGRALASSGASALARGALTGAAAGGAEGAVSYGVSCSSSPGGCSVSGAAKATTGGAALGGLFGAAASKFGRKGCTPHSFTATTSVVLASGAAKPISEIKVGDWVLTAEPGSKKKEKHPVKAVIVTKTDRDYVDVVVATKSGTKTIQTTAHHQFYDASVNSWTQAKDLKAHHKLQDAAGGNAEIVNVKGYQAQRTTYDLSVDGLHTYHVVAGDFSVLVHNTDGEACPIGPGAVKWPNFRSTKTAAETDGKFLLSGWSNRKPKVFTKVNVGDVAAMRQEMGMPTRGHGLDNGKPGQYFNSHAEKQAEILNPGGHHNVSRPMCDDCQDWFGNKAVHDGETKRVSAPDGLNVFHPNGKREKFPYGEDD